MHLQQKSMGQDIAGCLKLEMKSLLICIKTYLSKIVYICLNFSK